VDNLAACYDGFATEMSYLGNLNPAAAPSRGKLDNKMSDRRAICVWTAPDQALDRALGMGEAGGCFVA
jgi:hypothetical protein